MDTQLSPLHPHTQPHEHRGKRRDTNTDVSISGYVQQPDHNTVRGHTTRSTPRHGKRRDADLKTAPQSFYKKLDTCNTRVHVHTPGRTTHGHNTRRQRPASAAAPCDPYSTAPGANPASRPQAANSRRHAAHAEVKPGGGTCSPALETARAHPSPPRREPRAARDPLADSRSRGPHLADQLPAPVDAPGARVAQEGGNRRAATAPPARRVFHPAGGLAGAWSNLRRTTAQWLGGPRAAGARLIG